jgi:hypothetical protein
MYWTTGIRFLTETRNLSVLHDVHTDSGGHPASYAMSTGGSFPGGKATGTSSHSELMNIFDGIPYEGDQHIASLLPHTQESTAQNNADLCPERGPNCLILLP